jgi:hypothetical protein
MLTKMTSDPLTEALGRRRNKAISIILRYKEDHIDDQIDEDTSDRFRTVVLDQINDFHDVCVDLIGASGGVVNELWVEKLEEIHDILTGEDGEEY